MAQTARFGLALGALCIVLGPACFSQGTPCAVAPVQSGPVASRTTSVENDGPVVVPGSGTAHLPPALRGADLGIALADARLDRMILLLQPSEASNAALDAMLSAQQTPGSCAFHRWMSPAQFADRFGNSAADVMAVAAWLESRGFTLAPLPAGRGWVEFSGTAAQVEEAFQTSVHRVQRSSGEALAVVNDISVPAALKPLIAGLVSLDGVRSTAAMTGMMPMQAPAAQVAAATSLREAGVQTPAVAASLLHLDSAHREGALGGGESIVVVARGAVSSADVAAFRAAFGLPAGGFELRASAGGDAGAAAADEAATLESEWAGVAAPQARIVAMAASSTAASDGIDLALADAVDGAAAHTIVVGSAACEAGMSAAHRAFYRAAYRQAAAEGIAVIAAGGDSGAAGCDEGGAGAVTTGYGVNALASTTWNTVVSAAMVDVSGAPSAWSDGAAHASGGGFSAAEMRPDWQPILGGDFYAHGPGALRSREGRALPDLAIPAADTADVAFCFGGTGGECRLMRAGGSSAAAAIFGGVSAMLAGKYGPQGNLAGHLYALSGTAALADVRTGNARLACVAGTPACGDDGTLGFDAADGFDLATGLGVPLAEGLLKAWANFQSAGSGAATVVLTVTPMVQNTTYNPSAQITLAATVSGGSGTPTGTVNFFDAALNANVGSAATLDATGNATVTITGGLALGGNNITAKYSGDGTYAAATSQALTVTTQPSTTSMTVTPSTTTPGTGAPFTVTVTLAVGSPPAGTANPSGNVTLNVDGAAKASSSLTTSGGKTTATFNVNSPSTAGVHTLQAIYAGDANYTASTSPAVTITSSKGATVTTLTASPSVLTPNVPETLSATVAPATTVSGTTYSITGTVAFYDGTTLLGTATLTSNTATLSNVTLSASTTHQITAVYSGDTNWTTSTSNPITLQVTLLSDTVLLTVNPQTAAPGQVVTLVATVTPSVAPATNIEQNPTGNVVFYNGTQILATAALTPGPNNTGIATLLNATLPPGQDAITAYYVGDLYYASGTSNAVTLTVQDFSIAPSGSNPPTNLNIIKGQAGTASFVVTGLGGYNGQIQVVCAVAAQDDMSCSPTPQQVTPTGTVTFTVTTYLRGGPASGAAPAASSRVWKATAGGTALAGLLLVLLPGGWRSRRILERARRIAGLMLLVAAVGWCGTGCSSLSGTASTASSGTPLGVATLKITGSAYVNNVVVSHSVYLTVNVLPPQ